MQKSIQSPSEAWADDPALDPLIGRTLGGIVLLERMGAGGGGTVYRVERLLTASLDGAVNLREAGRTLFAREFQPKRFSKFVTCRVPLRMNREQAIARTKTEPMCQGAATP